MSRRNNVSSISLILGLLGGGVLAWFAAPSVGWGYSLGLFAFGLMAGWGCHAFLTAPPPIRTFVKEDDNRPKGRRGGGPASRSSDRGGGERGADRPRGAERSKPAGRNETSKVQQTSRSKRVEGVVKWFDDTKGWGFIVPDSGSEECFVHRTAVEGGRRLKEGERVEFHIEKDDRGRIAAGEVKKL